jgi:hypothetical protein
MPVITRGVASVSTFERSIRSRLSLSSSARLAVPQLALIFRLLEHLRRRQWLTSRQREAWQAVLFPEE